MTWWLCAAAVLFALPVLADEVIALANGNYGEAILAGGLLLLAIGIGRFFSWIFSQ